MRKKKRDDLWKCLFYLRNIAVFKGLGLHLVCEKERKIEWDAELDAKSVLASFRDDFRVVFGAGCGVRPATCNLKSRSV